MFDLFSWSHILILLAVALVVVGPKDLPKLMNMVGKWAGKARAMANEFKKSFDDMARQSELDELRKEITDLKSHQSITDLQADLSRPLDMDMPSGSPLDTGPDPRAGELQITDTTAGTTAGTAPPPRMTASP
jgi:sec-independent protein translocase protein TatB